MKGEIRMKKNEMIKKIKFMEMAIEQGEKLDLLCTPLYNHFGTFLGLEMFFMSSNMSKSAITTRDNHYYMVLNHKDIERKESDIDDYIDSFCKCHELYDFDDDAEIKCTCKLPSKEEAEAKWYDDIVEKIEQRIEEIEKMIGEK